VVRSVTLKASELYVTVTPDIVNPVAEQNRREISPGCRHPRTVVIEPAIPAAAVKVEIIRSGVNQVIRNPDGNIHSERRRIDEPGGFINIDLRRQLVLSRFRHQIWRWWRGGIGWRRQQIRRRDISLGHGWWRRCGNYRLGSRNQCAAAVSGHLVTVGVHALEIGVVIAALCFPAGHPACVGAYCSSDQKPACGADQGARSGMAGARAYGCPQSGSYSCSCDCSGGNVLIVILLSRCSGPLSRPLPAGLVFAPECLKRFPLRRHDVDPWPRRKSSAAAHQQQNKKWYE